MSSPPPPQVVHIFSMEAEEEWKQLLELLSAGFPFIARDSERETTVKGLILEMDVAPIVGSELYRLYELLSLLFLEGLKAYKLNLAKIEERRSFARKPLFSNTVLLLLPSLEERAGVTISRWDSEQVRGLTDRLGDIGFEVAAFGDFNVYLQGLLSSQEAKLEGLEKERDRTFDMVCEMFSAAAQGEQENSHMDSHLKDFMMAIRKQLNFIPIVTVWSVVVFLLIVVPSPHCRICTAC
ncbi:hypothetical protein NL676_004551 [Syzygium grande]|nr:hypothetical protein NL676_004551 [Syzygium grande]